MSKDEYNQLVLRRIDPSLGEIFYTSSICNLYKFDLASGEWDKHESLGTLFLYSRENSEDSPYALLILNRKTIQDFGLGIRPHSTSRRLGLPPMSIKLEGELIMVQDTPDEIYGFWLFAEEDRQPCYELLQWCLGVNL